MAIEIIPRKILKHIRKYQFNPITIQTTSTSPAVFKYTYLALFTAVTLLFNINTAHSQSPFTLISGQRIIITKDGNWKEAPKNETADITPFEIPVNEDYALSTTALEEVERFEKKALKKEADAFVKLHNFKLKKIDVQKDLKEGKDKYNEKERRILKNRIDFYSNSIKVAERKYKEAGKLVEKIKNIPWMSYTSRMAAFEEIYAVLGEESTHSVKASSKSAAIYQQRFTTSFEIDESSPYDKKTDCKLAFDAYDEKRGIKRTETETGKFFTYTNPRLRHYFKHKDYLTCNASLEKYDDQLYLKLKITLASKDGKKNYGSIDTENILKITLIDGKVLYSENILQSNGEIEQYTGHTHYEVIYPVKKSIFDTELEKIGIQWSSGYEEYDIYNVDFLINQYQCIK